MFCEFVGLYILDVFREKVPKMNFRLCRDDGLAEHPKTNGETLEIMEQKKENLQNHLSLENNTAKRHISSGLLRRHIQTTYKRLQTIQKTKQHTIVCHHLIQLPTYRH